MDPPAVAKTHFVLRRMRVGIDALRVHRQVQHVGREAAVEQHVPIGVADRMGQRLVGHAATVDKPVLQVRLAAIERRQPDPARQRDALGLALDVDTLLGKGIATKFRDTLPLGVRVASRSQFEDGPLIVT